MAINVSIWCYECKAEKYEIISVNTPKPSICSECLNQKRATKKKEHLEELKKLSIEDRLSKIEEQLYEDVDVLRKAVFKHNPTDIIG